MSFGTLGDIIQDILFGVKDTGEAAPVALTSQNALKVYIEGGSSGVSSHPALTERDAPSQHPASSIVNTPAGNITSTNVQDAINELDAARATHYAGVISKPSYTDNGDGTVTIGSGEFQLYSTYSDESAPVRYTVSGGTFTLTDGAINYIYIDYNSGIPAIKHTTTRNDIASTYLMTASPIYTIFRQGTTLFKLDWGQSGLGTAEKLVLRTINLHRYERESGLALADAGSKHFTLTSGVVWYGLNNKSLDAVNSATDDVHYYYWNGSSWIEVATTEYITNYYQDTSGLSTLTNGRYAVNWVYRFIRDTKRVCILLGTGDYKLSEAQASSAPESIPADVSAMGMLVGRIIVEKNATTPTQIDSAFTSVLSQGTTTIHNDLSGLQGGSGSDYYHIPAPARGNVIYGDASSAWANLSPGNAQETLSTDGTDIVWRMNNASNGFIDRTSSTLGMSGSTFQLSVVSGSFSIYSAGKRFTYTTTQEVSITNDLTQHFVYFNTSGVLTVSTTAWDLYSDNVPVAIVYKDGSNYSILDERHGYRRNRSWHAWAHTTIGARYASGLAGTFNNTTFSIAEGTIYDEDIELSITPAKSACTLLYRNSGGTAMRTELGITLPWKLSATPAPQYDNGGTLTDVTPDYYFCSYVYATNDKTYPIYIVVGQAQYSNVTGARNDTLPSTPGQITKEWKLLYRLIYRRDGSSATYIEAQDFREVFTGPGSSYSQTHNPVSLDSNADTLLSLSTQVLGLDTQAANLVFAGPTSGAAAVPTMRGLVFADIPSSSNPGAAAAVLATNTSGQIQLTGLGIGVAPRYNIGIRSQPTFNYVNVWLYGIGNVLQHAPVSDGYTILIGYENKVIVTGTANNSGALYSARQSIGWQSSGAITSVVGEYIRVDENYGYIGTIYGVMIHDIAQGSYGEAWSLYSTDADAPSYFAGNLLIGTIDSTGLGISGGLKIASNFIHTGTVFESGDTTPKFGGYTLTIPATGTVALGTGTNTHLAFWSGPNTLSSTSALTWDGSQVTVSDDFYMTAAGWAGMGTTPMIGIRLTIGNSATDPAYGIRGMSCVAAATYTSDSAQLLYAQTNNANLGVSSTKTHSAIVMGVASSVSLTSTFAGTQSGPVYGIYSALTGAAGAAGTVSGSAYVYTSAISFQAGTTVWSTIYGYYQATWDSAAMNGNTVANAYGIYLCSISAGTTQNYAIYTNAGKVRFGDNVLIGTSTDGMTANGSLAIAQDLAHRGTKVGFYNTTPVTKPTVTGSRGGNAALASLLTALAGEGLITNSTSA